MSLRDRARADKWGRIRAAAHKLFLERGYEGTTVRAIAEEAGVATGTVLVYGDTKDALLHELWRSEAMPIVEAAVAAAPPDDLVARCMQLFAPLLAHYAAQPELARVVVKELPWLTGSAADAHRPALMQLIGALYTAVEAAKARGEARADLDALFAAELLFGLYYAALLRMLTPVAPHTLTQAEEALRRSLAEVFVGFRRSS